MSKRERWHSSTKREAKENQKWAKESSASHNEGKESRYPHLEMHWGECKTIYSNAKTACTANESVCQNHLQIKTAHHSNNLGGWRADSGWRAGGGGRAGVGTALGALLEAVQCSSGAAGGGATCAGGGGRCRDVHSAVGGGWRCAWHLGVRPQGYLRIWKDMKGYERIWQDMTGYLLKIRIWMEIISKKRNSRYPKISFHTHVYTWIYSCKIFIFISAKVIQGIRYYILYILFYPSSISRENIPNDIQLWYPDYIQIYSFVSKKYICFRYPWCYPIWLSWNILFILVLNPEKISVMISNYDILVISKYIHVYPI